MHWIKFNKTFSISVSIHGMDHWKSEIFFIKILRTDALKKKPLQQFHMWKIHAKISSEYWTTCSSYLCQMYLCYFSIYQTVSFWREQISCIFCVFVFSFWYLWKSSYWWCHLMKWPNYRVHSQLPNKHFVRVMKITIRETWTRYLPRLFTRLDFCLHRKQEVESVTS